jgi:hypothetical protein
LALMIVLYVIAGLPLKELGMLASVCATGVVVMTKVKIICHK